MIPRDLSETSRREGGRETWAAFLCDRDVGERQTEMPTEQISYNEIEMREERKEISCLLELGGRALEIAPISLPSSPHSLTRSPYGFRPQRKLIEGIDKLAKNTTTATAGAEREREKGRSI